MKFKYTERNLNWIKIKIKKNGKKYIQNLLVNMVVKKKTLKKNRNSKKHLSMPLWLRIG
jgi:hypothetical protein